MKKPPEEIPFGQTICPICKKEMEQYGVKMKEIKIIGTKANIGTLHIYIRTISSYWCK